MRYIRLNDSTKYRVAGEASLLVAMEPYQMLD